MTKVDCLSDIATTVREYSVLNEAVPELPGIPILSILF